MIHSAKILANHPSDKENFLVWANCNEKVKIKFKKSNYSKKTKSFIQNS
jgi:hypothetical protein